MTGFTMIDMVILIAYLGLVLLAGLHFSKKDMKGKEYFKGDGTIPWWVTSVSIFATLLSPISFLSIAGIGTGIFIGITANYLLKHMKALNNLDYHRNMAN